MVFARAESGVGLGETGGTDSMARRSPFSPLSRALFGTRLVMIWERLLPALFPYVLLVLILVVAGQWGLFLMLPGWAHIGVLVLGLAVALFASVRGILAFRMPGFTELNARLALDNALRPERLLAMRHESAQPRLKIGKAKAGIAAADPFALRYVALVAAMLGFLVLGPVPVSRILSGFCLTPPAPQQSFADMSLARK